MPAQIPPPPALVSVTREQYLTREETRLRSLARLHQDRPEVRAHLTAVEFAEDLHDVHEAARNRQRSQGANAWADSHESFRQKAHQLRLIHLDALDAIFRIS